MATKEELLKQSLLAQANEAFQSRQQDELQQRMIKRSGPQKAHREKSEKLWQQFEDATKNLIHSSLKGYDTWLTAMGDILAYSITLGETLSHDIQGIYNQIGTTVLDFAVDTIKQLEKKPVTLPDLQQCVTFDDNGCLDASSINTVLRSDHREFTAQQKKLLQEGLEAGVGAWLAQRGYIPVPNPNKAPALIGAYQNPTTQARLTKAEFEAMRDEVGAHGLNAFLTGKFGMNVSTAPRM